MNNVTAIIVSYNTPELMKSCYESIRKHYPYLHCILIDGSRYGSRCFDYVNKRCRLINTVETVCYNIGHGNGMKLGISLCKTDYFLLMDSDVTIDNPGIIELMLKEFDENTYGVGQVMSVDSNGMNVRKGIPYLHPHFALISKENYLKFSPIINHGAPMLKAMISLNENKDYHLKNMRLVSYITHHERGTRKLNPKDFHPKNWDKV